MQILARLSPIGRWHIRGSVAPRQTLPAAATNPQAWDSDRSRLQFALSDGTTVMELDTNGNMYLAGDKIARQTLEFAGSASTVGNNASIVWINIGSVRVAEISTLGLKLASDIIERARESYLL